MYEIERLSCLVTVNAKQTYKVLGVERFPTFCTVTGAVTEYIIKVTQELTRA